MVQEFLPGIGERNQLYCGDCLHVLDIVPDNSVDLIYVDPPFYSQRVYEAIWGEEAERFAFEDRWSGGINHYANYLTARVRKMYTKLKEAGSFYVHLDWHISHYMKVELDKIFGYGRFQAEIIWRRTSAHVDTVGFGHVTDSIFFYSKSDKFAWNPQYRPYSEEHLVSSYRHKDPATGKPFMLADLTGAGVRHGETGKPWRGVNPTRWSRHWIRPPADLEALDSKGLVYWPDKKGGMPRLKKFLSSKGQPIDNIWTDISPVTSQSRERLGYPTQKPLALLERIVNASSNRDDLVMDAYCGCGTTLAAAQRLGRRWIGIDISQSAIRVVEQRLRKLGATNFVVHGLVKTVKQLKDLNPFEFQNWAVNAVYGQHSPRKVADMGVDGFTFMEHHPIQVKQVDHVGRPVIDAFAGVLQREKEKKGMVIAFGFTSGAVDEVARLEREDKIKIELIKCSDLIAGNVPFRIMV